MYPGPKGHAFDDSVQLFGLDAKDLPCDNGDDGSPGAQ